MLRTTPKFKAVIETSNKWIDEDRFDPVAVVVHVTQGDRRDIINYIESPSSQVSYHRVVTKNGLTDEYVYRKHAAWHSGNTVRGSWSGLKKGVNPNWYTFGLAFYGFATEKVKWKQYLELARNINELLSFAEKPINKNTVVFHREIRDDKSCPGEKLKKRPLIYLAKAIRFGYYIFPR